MTKIDITSTVLEKSIDVAKNFLDKLITPSIEETGLLIKDKVTLWRFNQQIKMLTKAKEICEKNNISIKPLSLKLLCPLLEYSSVEDNEILQDKWSILLSNLVDSDQNIENHVFPYILSQMSLQEFTILEQSVNTKKARVEHAKEELNLVFKSRPETVNKIQNKIAEISDSINKIKNNNIENPQQYQGFWNLENERNILKNELSILNKIEEDLEKEINRSELFPVKNLKEYEISNLTRLAVIKEVALPYAFMDKQRVPNNPHEEYIHLDDIEITIDSENKEYKLTQLGELFITACSEKK